MCPIVPSLEEFRLLAPQGNLIPLTIDLVADTETPISVFARVQSAGPCFLFESAEKNEESGRFSFIGTDPLLTFESRDRNIFLAEGGSRTEFVTETDPLTELQSALRRFRFVRLAEM